MVKDCHNCEHHTWGDEWWNCKTECSKCKYTDMQGEKVPSNWKPLPMTNADRIRAMSDEELVAWAHKQIGCGFDYFPCGVVCEGKCEAYSKEACDTKILEWLKQPAEVTDNG